MNKTLYDLQPGDRVFWDSRWNQQIVTVERVTTNYVICNKQKYRKSDGNSVSSDKYCTCRIQPLTPELEEQFRQTVKHQRLCAQANHIDMASLTIEQLQAILDIAHNTKQ